ncbi:hypothetical protein BDB01DRAFT_784000 [Pilobolus umbonatus]|nr:hypothetical protein BDB01DRAFT_784000 [Pilobolus umbonatus]
MHWFPLKLLCLSCPLTMISPCDCTNHMGACRSTYLLSSFSLSFSSCSVKTDSIQKNSMQPVLCTRISNIFTCSDPYICLDLSFSM